MVVLSGDEVFRTAVIGDVGRAADAYELEDGDKGDGCAVEGEDEDSEDLMQGDIKGEG